MVGGGIKEKQHSFTEQSLWGYFLPSLICRSASFIFQKVKVMALQLIGGAALGGFFQTLFQELTVILHKGLDRRWDLNSELEKLKRKLATVQAVIDDAERRRYTEPDVNYWVDDLRELIYDIDDTVDEMNTRRLELEQMAVERQDEVRNFFSFALDKGKEVQFKETIKSKIKNVLDKLDEAIKEAKALELRRNTSGSSWGLSQARVTSPSIDASDVYGRKEDKEKIIELLFAPGSDQNEKNYSVIPIVGMGGVGKTTLAQIIFQDERVKSQFSPRSWACVSDVFDIAKVTKELVGYSTKDNCPDMSLAELQDRLENMVRGKKFLLVLDDIWTVKEWDRMKAPFSHCGEGSIILMTTRSHIVAKAISNRPPYELGILEDDQCWNLFKCKAFGKVDADVDENLVQLGKGIVRKCRGVPLAVKVLGAMLQGAELERWEAVLKNELWHLQNDDDEIFPALRLSYHYLLSPLKRCFEYFSLFPSDYSFDKERLIYLWIGEGLIEAKQGRVLEDIGSQYFDDLKRRCLIQKDDKVHDLVHNLACTISAEFYHRLHTDRKSFKPLARARHVSIVGNNMDDGEYRLLAEATGLRTILLFRSHSQGLVHTFSAWRLLRVVDLSDARLSELPSSIGELKHMRFLDLSNNQRIRILPDEVCKLYNLQYLKLAWCYNLENIPKDIGSLINLRYLSMPGSKISSLPKSICKLYNLQVLYLASCRRLAQLPKNIGDLHGLRRLNLAGTCITCVPESIVKASNLQFFQNYYTFDKYVELPPHIGMLTSLERLGMYPIRKDTGRGIGELKDMSNLRGKLIISGMENIESVEEAKMADLKSKKHIEKLEFRWSPSLVVRDGEVEAKVLEALEPHPTTLTVLSFKDYSGDMFPKWIYKNCFFSLTMLKIEGLNRLRNLVGLKLPSLKSLDIRKCPSLREVSMAAPKLTFLKLEQCEELELTAVALLVNFEEEICVNLVTQLEELYIDSSQLECLQQLVLQAADLGVPLKLTHLQLVGCQNNITSFPMVLLRNVTSLKSLKIKYFPELHLPPDDYKECFPSSLRIIQLCECSNLNFLPKALISFTSLENLWIKGPTKSITFGEGLPTSLTFLQIDSCDNLTHLPKDLYNLTSLERIDISSCPQLEVRQEDRLPPSLKQFFLEDCPKLEQQLQQESTTDWPVLDVILKFRARKRFHVRKRFVM